MSAIATPSPQLETLLLLSSALARARAELDAALSRVGLWLDDLALLTIVSDAGGRGIARADLQAALSISASETVRRIRPMEKLSWIERTDDGRVLLTDAGRALVAEATGLAANRSEAWLDGILDERELTIVQGLLRRLAD